MQTGQQGRAVGGIGLIEQHPRVERLGLEHAAARSGVAISSGAQPASPA